jgi:hypothetical protein
MTEIGLERYGRTPSQPGWNYEPANLVVTDAKGNVQPTRRARNKRSTACSRDPSRVIAGAGVGSVYNARAKVGGETSISRSI